MSYIDVTAMLYRQWAASNGARMIQNHYARLPEGCPYPNTVTPRGKDRTRYRVQVPCGQCVRCRAIALSRKIGRSQAERSSHETGVVLTLTLDDKSIAHLGETFRQDKRAVLKREERKRLLMLRDGHDPFATPQNLLMSRPDSGWKEFNELHKKYLLKADGFSPLISEWTLTPLEITQTASFWKAQKEAMLKRFFRQYEIPRLRYEATYEMGPENLRPHGHVLLYGVPPELVPLRRRQRVGTTGYWPHGHVLIDDMKPPGVRYVQGYLKDATKRPYHIGHAGSAGIGDEAIRQYIQHLCDVRDGISPRKITIRDYPDSRGYLEKPIYQLDHRIYLLTTRHADMLREAKLLPAKTLFGLELRQAADEESNPALWYQQDTQFNSRSNEMGAKSAMKKTVMIDGQPYKR